MNFELVKVFLLHGHSINWYERKRCCLKTKQVQYNGFDQNLVQQWFLNRCCGATSFICSSAVDPRHVCYSFSSLSFPLPFHRSHPEKVRVARRSIRYATFHCSIRGISHSLYMGYLHFVLIQQLKFSHRILHFLIEEIWQ